MMHMLTRNAHIACPMAALLHGQKKQTQMLV